ncbi:hypothetical protein BDC45DRAFT_561191 [Circinella umbellata]|nr:hypothetical protein BDC45DRAFT_561191 [Circinella umbellata]
MVVSMQFITHDSRNISKMVHVNYFKYANLSKAWITYIFLKKIIQMRIAWGQLNIMKIHRIIVPESTYTDRQHSYELNISKQNSNLSSLSTTRIIDFITESPYDILCEILSYLDVIELAKCFDINKTWSGQLLQYSQPWKEISIRAYYSHDIDRIQAYEKMIPIVSKYVQSLFLGSRPDRLVKRFIPMLSIYKFPILQSLTLHITSGCKINGLEDSIYEGLSSISHTLKELNVDLTCLLDHRFSLIHILSICQRLLKITYKTQNLILSEDDKLLNFSCTTKLESLELIQKRLPLSTNIELLLQHSPNLRHISITGFKNNTNVMSIIKHHCPKLISIAANIDGFEHTYQIPSNTTRKTAAVTHQQKYRSIPLPVFNSNSLNTNDITKSSNTLQQLIIRPLDVPNQQLISRLRINRESLHTMCLGPRDGGAFHQDWVDFASFSFPNLTYLHINGAEASHNFLHDHLPRMIMSYPALKTLVLERIYQQKISGRQHQHYQVDDLVVEPSLTDDIFDAITKSKQLTCVRLFHCDLQGRGFKQFIKQSSCALQELGISRCSGTSTTLLLQYIPNIRSLQKLRLHCTDREVKLSDMTLFTQLLRERLDELSTLELGGHVLSDEAVLNIAMCPRLHTFFIHGSIFTKQGRAKNMCLLRKYIKNVQLLSCYCPWKRYTLGAWSSGWITPWAFGCARCWTVLSKSGKHTNYKGHNFSRLNWVNHRIVCSSLLDLRLASLYVTLTDLHGYEAEVRCNVTIFVGAVVGDSTVVLIARSEKWPET